MIAPSANGHRGTILVTDAGRASALAVIRSLGRGGWRVIAADADPAAPGLRSRYAAERALYPSPHTAAPAFADAIEGIVRERGVDLVIPSTDEVVHVLAGERKRFEPHCRLAIADAKALGIVMDKWATVRLAEKLGVPTPRTRLVRSASEAREAAEELGWPVVLKSAVTPCVDEHGVVRRRPVSYAASPAELELRFGRYFGGPVLMQEYCPGRGSGVEMLADRGRPLAAFQHRRLAEVPLSGGASAWRESVALDPELLSHATSLVTALRWTGLIMVEFKVGERISLMEINGRVWGSMPLAVRAGMDFPARLAELLLGAGPASGAPLDCTYRAGIHAYNLELTALWIANVLSGRQRYPFLPHPRRREAIRAMASMLSPRGSFDVLSGDDLRPGLAEMGRIPRKLLRKIAEAIRSGAGVAEKVGHNDA